MRVTPDLFLEKLLIPGGGGIRAKKIFAHVVVNTDDLQSFVGKISCRFRTDQPGRTCDERDGHVLIKSVAKFLINKYDEDNNLPPADSFHESRRWGSSTS